MRRPAPLSTIAISGWKRIFNAPFDGYAFLNLQPDESVEIEAGYFELDPADRHLFAEREAGADLIEVMSGFYAFIGRDTVAVSCRGVSQATLISAPMLRAISEWTSL